VNFSFSFSLTHSFPLANQSIVFISQVSLVALIIIPKICFYPGVGTAETVLIVQLLSLTSIKTCSFSIEY